MRFQQLKRDPNNILRKKLVKSGKSWIVVASLSIAGGAFLLGSPSIVKADDTSDSATTQAVQVQGNVSQQKAATQSTNDNSDNSTGKSTEEQGTGATQGQSIDVNNKDTDTAPDKATVNGTDTPAVSSGDAAQSYKVTAQPVASTNQNQSNDIFIPDGVDSNNIYATGIDGTSKYSITKDGTLYFDAGELKNSDASTDSYSTIYIHSKYSNLVKKIDTSHSTGKVSLPKDSNSLFYGWTNLESIDLSNIDSSHTTDMSYIFDGDTSLKSITGLSNLDTSNVTDMSSMFANMTDKDNNNQDIINLESLDLSKFSFKSNPKTDNLFTGTTLKSITLGPNDASIPAPNLPASFIDWANIGNGSASNPQANLKFKNSDELKAIYTNSTNGVETFVPITIVEPIHLIRNIYTGDPTKLNSQLVKINSDEQNSEKRLEDFNALDASLYSSSPFNIEANLTTGHFTYTDDIKNFDTYDLGDLTMTIIIFEGSITGDQAYITESFGSKPSFSKFLLKSELEDENTKIINSVLSGMSLTLNLYYPNPTATVQNPIDNKKTSYPVPDGKYGDSPAKLTNIAAINGYNSPDLIATYTADRVIVTDQNDKTGKEITADNPAVYSTKPAPVRDPNSSEITKITVPDAKPGATAVSLTGIPEVAGYVAPILTATYTANGVVVKDQNGKTIDADHPATYSVKEFNNNPDAPITDPRDSSKTITVPVPDSKFNTSITLKDVPELTGYVAPILTATYTADGVVVKDQNGKTIDADHPATYTVKEFNNNPAAPITDPRNSSKTISITVPNGEFDNTSVTLKNIPEFTGYVTPVLTATYTANGVVVTDQNDKVINADNPAAYTTIPATVQDPNSKTTVITVPDAKPGVSTVTLTGVPEVAGYITPILTAYYSDTGIVIKDQNDKTIDADHPATYTIKPSNNNNSDNFNTNDSQNVASKENIHEDIATYPDQGNVPIYQLASDNSMTSYENRELAHTTDWLTDQKVTIGKDVYYRVATNEYVKANRVYQYVYTNVKVRTNSDSNKKLYTAEGNLIGNRQLAASSNWKTDRIAIVNNVKYYRVATNEFIRADDVYVY